MNQAKEFFQYIFNAIKIWVIVQPWEAGLRVRCGKQTKKLTGGVYFRIPYFDNVFIQETRLRVCEVPIQTCTTKDMKSVTIKAAVGYSIVDVEKLYNTLYHPETSILNIAMSEAATMIFENDVANINPLDIERRALDALNKKDYGIKFEYFKITNFAVVRTYRLIQDPTDSWEGLNMNDKK